MNQLIIPADSDILTPMTVEEAEACITEIHASHQHTGEKLLELHDREGWKTLSYSSWRECVKARFSDFGQSRAYQLLAAETVRRNIAPVIEKNSTTVEKPIPERQLRPLAKLKPEEQREVWAEVSKKPVTAKRVKKAVSIKQRIQIAVQGTPMQRSPSAAQVLANYHKLQGEEVFQKILELVATGEYDTPHKAFSAYQKGENTGGKPGSPPPKAPPPKKVSPCPTCGCTCRTIRP